MSKMMKETRNHLLAVAVLAVGIGTALSILDTMISGQNPPGQPVANVSSVSLLVLAAVLGIYCCRAAIPHGVIAWVVATCTYVLLQSVTGADRGFQAILIESLLRVGGFLVPCWILRGVIESFSRRWNSARQPSVKEQMDGLHVDPK